VEGTKPSSLGGEQGGREPKRRKVMLRGTARQLNPGKLEKEFAKSKSADRKVFAAKIDR
jgi:hypothetical protein